MKSKLFLLVSSLFLVNTVFSQSLMVTGDTLVYGSIDDFGIEAHAIVKNVSSNTVTVLCEKTVISEPSTASNDFCWGGTCYGSGTMISTKMDTLSPGEQTNGFTGYFHPFIPGPAAPGTGVVEYCFYPSENPTDRSCVTVTYHANENTTSMLEEKQDIITFYPNPATDFTKVFSYHGSNINIQISDILGNCLKTIVIQKDIETIVNLDNFTNGVYFVNIFEGEELFDIKKLIINK